MVDTEFLPQNINAVRSLQFSNDGDSSKRVHYEHCDGETRECSTHSARIYSIEDVDGSVSGTGQPTIIGSPSPWWNAIDGQCTRRDDWGGVYTCPWRDNLNLAWLELDVPGLTNGCRADQVASAVGLPNDAQCRGQTSPYRVGYVQQWNRASPDNAQVSLSPWPGVTGIANGMWVWRTKSPVGGGIDGAPSRFSIGNVFNMPRNVFVLLAVRYPTQAQFEVTLQGYDRTIDTMPMASSLAAISRSHENMPEPDAMTCGGQWWSQCEEWGSNERWYFDRETGWLYLRVVASRLYNRNDRNRDRSYERDGVSLWGALWDFVWQVRVTQCNGCDVQATHGGTTYYRVPDTKPPQRFAQDYGSGFRPLPNAPTSRTRNTCGGFVPATEPKEPNPPVPQPSSTRRREPETSTAAPPSDATTRADEPTPTCQAGQTGCVCLSDDTCSDSSHCKTVQASAQKRCVPPPPKCLYGDVGCPCEFDKQDCASAFECKRVDGQGDVCVRKVAACPDGALGCKCADGACTDATHVCAKSRGGDDFCTLGDDDREQCMPGTLNCACYENETCAEGHVCTAVVGAQNSVCLSEGCPDGELGCMCTAGRKCNDPSFSCAASADSPRGFCTRGTINAEDVCVPGSMNCACDKGVCNAGLQCEPIVGEALPRCLDKIEFTDTPNIGAAATLPALSWSALSLLALALVQ